MAHENLRCVVLSADMVPISIVSSLEALVHYLENKVYILEEHEGVNYHTVNDTFPAPSLVCLNRYIKNLPDYYYPTASLTLDNIRVRDDGKCQYCGRSAKDFKEDEYWTKDHIFPKSRGGQDKWTNLVLCCSTCNQKKGDRTPEEANMKLIRGPIVPTRRHIELLKRN